MIFVDYPVCAMLIVCIFGRYLCKRQHYLSILPLVCRIVCQLPWKSSLYLDDDREYLKVLNEVQEMLRREHLITRVTIQIEPYDEQIMNSCETCRMPET